MNDDKTITPGRWHQQKEKAAGYWHVKLMLVLFRLFPVIVLRMLAFPVGFFYFLFSKKSRIESGRFLKKAAIGIGSGKTGDRCRSPLGPLRHIVSFSLTLVEKVQSWGGKFPFKHIHFQDDDIQELIQGLENGTGAVLVCSHLGNTELLRGLASFNQTGVSRKIEVTSIIDMEITAYFNRMLKELNPQSALDIISVKDINPDTVLRLEEKLAAGGLLVIAGDRTSAGKSSAVHGKELLIPFLGSDAPFSSGAFYLTALLKAPVYFVFALRRGDLSIKPEYDMFIHKGSSAFNSIKEGMSRKDRFIQSASMAQSFALLLENYCKKFPFQWYNFYDFWYKEE